MARSSLPRYIPIAKTTGTSSPLILRAPAYNRMSIGILKIRWQVAWRGPLGCSALAGRQDGDWPGSTPPSAQSAFRAPLKRD
jgi:hypothetical protein